MILAIEVDNSRINLGIFENDGILLTQFGVATDVMKTSDEYAVLLDGLFNYYKVNRDNVQGVVMCSVVPMLTNVIYNLMNQIFTNVKIIKIQKGIKTGFSIKVDNPAELGADLVANATAVIEIQKSESEEKQPSVIVDLGTATTIFALNEKNEFIGGSIIPGVEMSFDVLHGKTAQLPNVAPISPAKAIGKNSQDSIRSGVILGSAIMIDGFVAKFAKEMNQNNIKVFITGEHAQEVMPLCSYGYRYVPNLTLFGLYCIYKNNTNL